MNETRAPKVPFPNIYLITGLMASGKSTVAELLARRLKKSVHLRGDVFRKMIVSGCVEMSERADDEAYDQLYMRYRITASVAKEYFDAGFHLVIQDNYYGKTLTDMVELLSPRRPKVVVLNPDVDTLMEREKQRNKKGYTGFDVEKLHQAFLSETPRIGLWLDTSGMTPEKAVERILSFGW